MSHFRSRPFVTGSYIYICPTHLPGAPGVHVAGSRFSGHSHVDGGVMFSLLFVACVLFFFFFFFAFLVSFCNNCNLNLLN